MSGPFRAGGSSPEDDKRFGELYEDTSRDLLAFLLRRCASAEDAADCLAESYRIASEKRNRIPAGYEARPWLFGVARNVARQEHRSGQRRAATSHAPALAAENSYTATTPDDTALAAAVSELSPVDQEILTMLTADGLAPREVASVLGLSPNAVRIRAHRARQKLQTLLAPSETNENTGPSDELSAAAEHGP